MAAHFSHSVAFVLFDLVVALDFHFEDSWLGLLFSRVVSVFVIHVAYLLLSDQIFAVELTLVRSYLSVAVVIVDVHSLLVQIELCLFDLWLRRDCRIKFKLLSHLFDNYFLSGVVFIERQVHISLFSVSRKRYTSIDKLVFSSFVILEGLTANLLLSVN